MSSTTNKKMGDVKITNRQDVIKTLNQLQCGEPFDFQFDSTGKQRLKCKLIGFNETNYLAFAVPTYAQKGYDDLLVNDHPCILRTIIERDSGLVVAFKSSISGIIKKPYPIFFVNYPKTIERYSLRNETRLSTHAPGSIMTKASESDEHNEIFQGTILDLSSTGCRFKLPWSMPSSTFNLTDIYVKITFPSLPEKPLTVKGKVKAVSSYDNDNISLGIKLENTTQLIDIFNRLDLTNNN